MKKIITKKYYDRNEKKFIVELNAKCGYGDFEKLEFDDFGSFYKKIKKDLTDTDLLGYNFDDYDPKGIDFKNAKISSKTMLKIGNYNKNNKYAKLIRSQVKNSTFIPSNSNELVPVRNCYDLVNLDDAETDIVMLYVSDLHLNHKLIDKFGSTVIKDEVIQYLNDIISDLSRNIPNFSYKTKYVFIGDISYNYEILKLFFKLFRERHSFGPIFFVLGNHELWDTTLCNKFDNLDEMIDFMRKELFDIGIALLENQLYFPHGVGKILNANQILELSDEEYKKLFEVNAYCFFGGMGFSGLNEKFNYNDGIYRDAPLNREIEIQRSKLVSRIHERLAAVVPDNKTCFFVTHMPKEDWSNSEFCKNFIYLSGHTHKNYYLVNDKIRYFADNQIGYKSKSFGFKFVTVSSYFNPFESYKDGIFEITRTQYLLFYSGISNYITFNREFKKLYMIKRANVYIFFMLGNNDNLYILNGGSIKNVGTHDLQYFYDNLLNYSESINMYLKSYDSKQKSISKIIKSIGGDGKIHGCIVDIDFLNHLYINPLDGTITPYYANSMVDKTVYKNFISLLKYSVPSLYLNFEKMLENKKKNELILFNNDLKISDETVPVYDTSIYKISRIVKGLQYATSYNVIRIWNDTIALDNSAESGKLIVSGIINPDEMNKLNTQIGVKINKHKLKNKHPLSKEERHKINVDKYKNKIREITNGHIEVIEYHNSSCPVTYKCHLCGKTFVKRSDKFRDVWDYHCPNCRKR